VQTGWGRTGQSFFGIQSHGVTPDMMTFAKGLGNGFAIGGIVARGDLMDALPAVGISTFGGNPIAMAAGNATLDYVLDHDLQANAARQGETIIGGLRAAAGRFPIVRAVRGKGLMFAVELAGPATGEPSPPLAATVMEAARERGLLVGKGGLYGNVVRMAPPLTLTDAEAAEGLAVLIDSLETVNGAATS
jgi:4-aminobutyrate aminotransferase